MRDMRELINANALIKRNPNKRGVIVPAWGGPRGTRPAFIYTSRCPGKVGKTATAKMICDIWGGAFLLHGSDWESQLYPALADESTAHLRCILWDDVKFSDFSYSSLKSLLTTNEFRIPGSTRVVPNLLTLFMTTRDPRVCAEAGDLAWVFYLHECLQEQISRELEKQSECR